MSKLLSATISVLLCSSANAGSLCPYDTPACRMMPDRYIAPQMAPDGSYSNPQTYRDPLVMPYPQMRPDGSYGRSLRMNPDGSYGDD
jgi:hypothetical protein